MTFETLAVSLGDRSYEIFLGRKISQAARKWVNRVHSGKSIYVVTDRNVASIYGDDIRRWLAEEPEKMLALPPGEEQKTFSSVSRIYAFLSEGKANKDSIVVAFGGGVVGDLAGFAAATFLRGIPFIQIPTTLLAMLDSSVGGKTGFNLPEGKNLVGAFHQPCAAFIDDAFLSTLDDRNLRSGLAEAIKSAIAGDAVLWKLLVERGSQWKAFSNSDWREIIRRSVSFKISVVERDERESSLRKVLNLGHTIGHALEQSGGYGRLLHGEAVAAGLAWEAVLGWRLGVTPKNVTDDILSLLVGMGYGLDVPDIPLASIEAAVGMDKKRVVSDIDLPLIARPGECEIKRVPLEKIRTELADVRAEIRNYTAEKEKGQGLSYLLEPQEAVRSLESYVTANPRDGKAIVLLADAYLRSGNMTAALKAIQEALGRGISDPPVLQMAAELEKRLPQEASGGEDAHATLPFENLLVMGEDAYQISVADPIDLPAEKENEWQFFESALPAPEEEAAPLQFEEPIPETAAAMPEVPVSVSISDSAPLIDTSVVPPVETLKESDAVALPAEKEDEWQFLESAFPAPEEEAAPLQFEESIPETAAAMPEVPVSVSISDSAPLIDTSIVPPVETLKESDAVALPVEKEDEWQFLESAFPASEEEAAPLRFEEPVPETADAMPETPASVSISNSVPLTDTAAVLPIGTPDEPKAREEPEKQSAQSAAEQSSLSLVEAFSSVGTITLADLYWSQGEWSAARKIVRQILKEDPGDARARKWMDSHGEEDPVESVLETFLDLTAKEFGYDLSRYH
ncbi:MAG: 3-dehydroquinate synthase [Syntrophorhabdaceae bacterium]|nr:3-dehydroquinate synthase [Syntrophorhabdaceae bacterium]